MAYPLPVPPVPAVLRHRGFRRVWLASVASNAGSWFQVVAAGFLVFELTGSASAVGGLAMVARMPAIVFATVAGHLADRWDRRAVGIACALLQGIGAGGLAIAAALGSLSVATIYLFTFVVGLGFALGLPSMLALVGEVAGPERLTAAVRMNAAGINVARMVGPTIGGAVLLVAGAATCFTLNALSFGFLVVALWVLPRFPPSVHASASSTRDALRYARRDPAARRLLIGAALFCALAAPLQELTPVVADRLDGGEVGLGLLLGFMGAGALAGAWWLARIERRGYPRHRALPMGTACAALGIAIVAVAPWLWLALIGTAMGGFFWIWIFTLTNTAIQLTSPPELRGRMLGLYQGAVVGPIALGAQGAGVLADVAGIVASLLACAAVLAAWGLWSLANPVREIDRAAPTA